MMRTMLILGSLCAAYLWVRADEYPNVKVGGFIASQFVNDESNGIEIGNQWRFRHARLYGISQISNKLNGFIQVETATGSVVLQNAFINLTYLLNTEIRVGYIKLPFGIEAYGHSLMNPTIDISRASKEIYRGAQDMGMHMKYANQVVTCWVAMVNGNSGKTSDNNSRKDFCGKFFLDLVKGLELGGSFYIGKTSAAELATNRYGAEVNYKNGPFWARGEFLGAKDEQAKGDDKESMGYYGVTAYRVTPQIEAVARYDSYDSDTKDAEPEWTNLTLGMSYYFAPDAWNRLSFNYEIREDKTDEKTGNLLTLQLQVLF